MLSKELEASKQQGNEEISSLVHSHFTYRCRTVFQRLQYSLHFLILFLIPYFILVAPSLDAQTPKTEEQLQAENLPQVIQAPLIDTTQIILEPRNRFNDASTPQLIHALALYAKERRWNLPPISTPHKVAKLGAPPPKNYMFLFSAYPSLPDSLFYKMRFGGHLNETRGFLHLNRQQLGDKRTQGRGDYSVDQLRGGLSYQYQPLSEFSLDIGLNLKTLSWLAESQKKVPKDLLLLRSDLNWKQQISERSHWTLNLDAAQFRLSHGGERPTDEGTDLRFKFDIATPMPLQNPFHLGEQVDINPMNLGVDVEYFSTTVGTSGDEQSEQNTWATILRLYIRDSFTTFGPAVLGMGAEGVSYRERDETGVDGTYIAFNPYLAITTELDRGWMFQLEGERTTHRPKVSDIYFKMDYISLNPLLRPEKTWKSRVRLKYHQGRSFEMNVSGFGQQIRDLVVLKSISDGSDDPEIELTWSPEHIDTLIYGGQLDISVHVADRLAAQFQYTHEFHRPDSVKQIAYRAKDLIDLKVIYYASETVRVELGGAARGPRYINADTAQTLAGYFLLMPKLSKTVVGHLDVFVGGTFSLGEYTVLDRYQQPQNNVDFGVELRF